jgi:hypothetical protein
MNMDRAISGSATRQGYEAALRKLAQRRKKNKTRKRIDNGSLPAGSPMHFDCETCGEDIAVAETYVTRQYLCSDCQQLKESGWLDIGEIEASLSDIVGDESVKSLAWQCMDILTTAYNRKPVQTNPNAMDFAAAKFLQARGLLKSGGPAMKFVITDEGKKAFERLRQADADRRKQDRIPSFI